MLTASLLLLILSYSKITSGIPLPSNEAGAQTVSWVSDPNGRGTVSLVETCVLTLSLCVWSAIHLNIPGSGETSWSRRLRNLKWIAVGIFGPELVVLAAWKQWSSAKALLEELDGLSNGEDSLVVKRSDEKISNDDEESHLRKSPSFKPKKPWHITQCFFAGMGGLSFDLDDDQSKDFQDFLPQDCQNLTLTPRGVALLAACGRLPDISLDDIEDKSKADGIAKALVCIQAIWMIVQVVERAASNLPVTLLEVNTIGHVLCALFIYGMWWNKPREVREPIKLQGDWVRPLMAYMFMSSRVSGKFVFQAKLLHRHRVEPELSTMGYFVPHSENSSVRRNTYIPISQAEAISEENISMEVLDAKNASHGVFEVISTSPNASQIMHSDTSQATNSDTSQQLIRTSLITEAITLYPCIRSRFILQNSPSSLNREYKPLVEELLVRRASNWPTDELLTRTGGLIMGMVLWFVSIGFGAVHVCAWNGFFPSTIERTLWRASGLFISASGALWLIINLLAHKFKGIDRYWETVLNNEASWITYAVLGILCTVCGLLYGCARLFLVVEAFISIRKLPENAYETPSWTSLIPHL